MFIKFVKDHAASGRKIGDVWETDEPIARAYISGGLAIEHKEAEADLLAAARSEIAAGFAQLQKNLTDQVTGLGRTIGSGLAQVGTGRRFNPQMAATESEDEKLTRIGGFRNLAHSQPGSPAQRRPAGRPAAEHGHAARKIQRRRRTGLAGPATVSSPDGMYEN